MVFASLIKHEYKEKWIEHVVYVFYAILVFGEFIICARE